MRASIYCRISRDREGAGLGVATQEHDCRELADQLGASIVSVHTDNDLSAYSGKKRPGYADLVESVRAGQIDAVLSWHTDRLHRSPAELEDYITACEAHGVRTITVKAGTIDLSTASGLVMARTLGAFARYEVDHARERMQRAKLRSAEAGKWKGGRRPFGYEPDGVTVRESEATLIRSAADRVLAGDSMRALAGDWNRSGVTTSAGSQWTGVGLRRLLIAPRGAGLMEHQGQVIGLASWPAIIDREKWEAVVRVLTDPARRTNFTDSSAKWLGSGLFLCGGCGGVMQSGRDRQGQPIYRCRTSESAGHVSRLTASVDEFVGRLVVERLRQGDLAKLMASQAERVDVRPLESKALELGERRRQLAEVFADGGIDAEQLASGSRSLGRQLDEVREQIAGAYRGTALIGIAETVDPGAAWLKAPLQRQRRVLDMVMAVTLERASKGRRPGWQPGESYFRPESVRIEWKS